MMFTKGKKSVVLPRLTLKTARVCVQCETLFSGRGCCPSCGSAESMPLSKWVIPMDRMVKARRLLMGVA